MEAQISNSNVLQIINRLTECCRVKSKRTLTIYSVFTAVLMLAFFVQLSHAQQPELSERALIVGVANDCLPYSSLDHENQPSGFIIDVFDIVAQRAGLTYRYQFMQSSNDLRDALLAGEIDLIANAEMDEELSSKTVFSQPYVDFPIKGFILNEETGVTSFSDLGGKTIAHIAKAGIDEMPESPPDSRIEKADRLEVAFYKLLNGQIDALIHNEPEVKNMARDFGLLQRLRVLEGEAGRLQYSVVLNREVEHYLEAINLSLSSLTGSDQFEEIYQRWFYVQVPFWTPIRVFWAMAGLMLLMVGALVFFRQRDLVNMNDRLQEQIDQATIQLSQRNAYLHDLTLTDTLTGISNRRGFEKSLSDLMSRSRRFDESFSMLIFDIDDFKLLNDEFGHDVGDIVLKDLVDRIMEIVRDVDQVCRWGGEEFTILMPNTDREGAMIMSERCRSAVSDVAFEDVGTVTISVGVTCYMPDDTERKLFKRADDALYEAKLGGKNRVVWKGLECDIDFSETM